MHVYVSFSVGIRMKPELQTAQSPVLLSHSLQLEMLHVTLSPSYEGSWVDLFYISY